MAEGRAAAAAGATAGAEGGAVGHVSVEDGSRAKAGGVEDGHGRREEFGAAA